VVTYFLDLAVENQAPQRHLALALRCIVLPMLEGAAEAKQQVSCVYQTVADHTELDIIYVVYVAVKLSHSQID
jgi:hypothetical protein